MDCIVLVGNRKDYRVVANDDNKAFLEINGRFILQIMLDELFGVEEIDRIMLVGPKQRLTGFLQDVYGSSTPKPLLVFEQGNDLLENALLPLRQTQTEANSDRHVLLLPSDIPLLTRAEVRQFIARADMSRWDFVSGLVTEETLARFAASADRPGISMLCFRLSCGSYRPNNMHMARPAAIQHVDYIRRLYGMRYQKRFVNSLKLMLVLLHSPLGFRGLFYMGRLSAAIQLRRKGWQRCARLLERTLSRTVGEWGVSQLLGGLFKTVVTDYGGTAIDVDNEADYRAVGARFEDWRRLLDALESP